MLEGALRGSDSEFVLKEEPTRFGVELDVRCE
jgi:hypothetical protein